MGLVEEFGDRKKMVNSPIDLFPRFTPANCFLGKTVEPSEEDREEIELGLGLSLNGRFGVDPRDKGKLTRSSSIPELVRPVKDEDISCSVTMARPPLVRTCSLPTETEEEWRKRKELQTLRRMEAKRKRSEKQRISKAVRERNRAFYEDLVNGNSQMQRLNEFTRLVSAKESLLDGDGGGFKRWLPSLPPPPPQPSSQGSYGSQETGSSGITEPESQPAQGTEKCTETRSPMSAHSLSVNEPKSSATQGTTTSEISFPKEMSSNKLVKFDKGNNGNRIRNMLEDMPCVSTKGDGPNGKRIEGFLYRYRKGEEVRIVCVCHGSFLTPAEFVKHAGGGDVAHPLKHIVVNPSFL